MPLTGALFVTNPRRKRNSWYGEEERHREAAKSSLYYEYLSGKRAPRKSVQKRKKGKQVGWAWGHLRKSGLYSGSPAGKTYGKASKMEAVGALRDLDGLIDAKVITKTQANKLIRKAGTGKGYKNTRLEQDVSDLLYTADARRWKGDSKRRKKKTQSKLNELLGSSQKAARLTTAEELFGISNPGRKTVRRRRNTRKNRINKLRLRLRRNALRVNRRRKTRKAKKPVFGRGL